MRRFILTIVAAGLGLAGCVSHHPAHPHVMPPGQAKQLVHVHGDGCGHVYVGGVWVVGSGGGHGHGRSGKH